MTIHARKRWTLPSGRSVWLGNDGRRQDSVLVNTDRGCGSVYAGSPCPADREHMHYNSIVFCNDSAIAVFETEQEADALVDQIAEHVAAGRRFIEISAGRITKSL